MGKIDIDNALKAVLHEGYSVSYLHCTDHGNVQHEVSLHENSYRVKLTVYPKVGLPYGQNFLTEDKSIRELQRILGHCEYITGVDALIDFMKHNKLRGLHTFNPRFGVSIYQDASSYLLRDKSEMIV